MNTTSATPTSAAQISHREGVALGRTAYARFADALATLGDDDWARPTDCEGWTVRDLAGHLVGAMRSAASFRELLSQQREVKARVRRSGGNEVDAMTQVQIDRTSQVTNAELAAECRALVDKSTAGRRRIPAPLRRIVTFPIEFESFSERWALGYLVDVILTRDTWLHRIDLCRAVDASPVLTPEHDGRIVADVVAEWARRHGEPYDLTLTGAAGGTFTGGHSGDRKRFELDAVEFCRMLSGRAAAEGLLSTPVPF